VLTVASVSLIGTRGLLDYVTAVLPAHAGAEIRFPFQYSLTYALGFLGVAQAPARLAGTIAYFVTVAFGLLLGRLASAALDRRELVVFLPALGAVVGGVFLHQEELCFALPATLVIATALQGRARAVTAFALCLLAIPWISVWGSKELFLASIFVCAVIVASLRIDLRLAVAYLGAIAAALYAFELHPPHLPLPPPGALRGYAPNQPVQLEWRDYVRTRSTTDPLWFVIKLPTWAALLAVLAVAARFSLRSPPASESSPGNLRGPARR
jgi:hypothetical protein